MIITRIFIVSLITLLSIAPSQNALFYKLKRNLIFTKVAERLKSLKSVSYHYKREFNYPSEGYIEKGEGNMYLEFNKEFDLAGFRYQFQDDQGISVFNNSEIFNCSISEKGMTVIKIVNPVGLEMRQGLFNSVVTLRNAFPTIISDASIPKHVVDTVLNQKIYYLLEFTLKNKFLNYTGIGFSTTSKELSFNYKLIVDKATLLPLTLLQNTINSKDLNRTDFTFIDIHPIPLHENSWYYSSYLKRYKIEMPKSPINILQPGLIAPNLELINYSTGRNETLSLYKGQMILLEFWIKNCGHCIEAVTDLNQLALKYGKQNFKVLAINTEDSKGSIDVFVKKHPVEYTIMYGNKPTIDQEYGISAFPQVILIDKVGKILYSGELNTSRFTQLIDKNL